MRNSREPNGSNSGSGKAPAVIGIDIGGTKMLGLVIDETSRTVVQEKWPTPKGAPEIVNGLAGLTADLVERTGETHEVRGVGVGIAGLVDSSGRLRRAPNLVDSDEFAVRDLLEPNVGLPVFVDNDANCAARAELHVGVAQGVKHAVLITLGTGIGGALIADGKIVRGAAGMAGEPGHMLVDPAGPQCVCGLKGCWERYASGAGLAYLGRRAAEQGDLSAVVENLDGDLARLHGEHVTRAGRLGDPQAAAVLDTFAWWVSVGMANCAAMSDPELIIVGGGLVRDWDLFGPRVGVYLNEVLVAAEHRPPIRCEPAVAGEAAGALGAAFLAATETGVLR
ncbi:MAG: ROK family protein [Actinomycetia bacterium]|nr:ROK family protein [Actinomycetes bacterium]